MSKLTQIIKQAYLSLTSLDDTAYPQGQATYNGKTTNFVRMSPYGLDSNPPKDSHVLLVSSQGQEATKFGWISNFLNRKKNLLEGEVVFHNPVTGAFVKHHANGDIEVNTPNDLIATATGNITATAGGTADITSTGNASITAPTILLNGTVGVGGVVTIPATGFDVGANAITAKEMTPPATPGALQGAAYFKNNGAGKTQYAVKFQDGTEIILATQP